MKVKFLKEKYHEHNYDTEIVAKWFAENYTMELDSLNQHEGSFGCACEDTDSDEFINDPKIKIYNHIDYIDFEQLVEMIPNLPEEVKEELEALETLSIYYCPKCKQWAIDSPNI